MSDPNKINRDRANWLLRQIYSLKDNSPSPHHLALKELIEHLSESQLSDFAQEKINVVSELFSIEACFRSLESLPINTTPVTKQNQCDGFVLTAGEWWPCSVMNVTKPGWVEYRIDYDNPSNVGLGSSGCDSGVAIWPNWAFSSMDHRPCIVRYEELKEENASNKKT